MSASALVTIFCDAPSCGQWEDDGIAPTAAQARRQLRVRGWRLNVPGEGNRREDFCPRHATTTQKAGPTT